MVKDLSLGELSALFFESDQAIRDKMMKIIGKKELNKIQEYRETSNALSSKEIESYKEDLRKKIARLP